MRDHTTAAQASGLEPMALLKMRNELFRPLYSGRNISIAHKYSAGPIAVPLGPDLSSEIRLNPFADRKVVAARDAFFES